MEIILITFPGEKVACHLGGGSCHPAHRPYNALTRSSPRPPRPTTRPKVTPHVLGWPGCGLSSPPSLSAMVLLNTRPPETHHPNLNYVVLRRRPHNKSSRQYHASNKLVPHYCNTPYQYILGVFFNKPFENMNVV